jgi:hypothetical protein
MTFRSSWRWALRRSTNFGKWALEMATREKRLAQFDGEGEPPPDLPVQVLCEDQSGTYELPFACRFVDGTWHNHESGGVLEANVIAWRRRRS